MDRCPLPVVPRRAGPTTAAPVPHPPDATGDPTERPLAATTGQPAHGGGVTTPIRAVVPAIATIGHSVPTVAPVVGGHPVVVRHPAVALRPPVAAAPIDRS